MPTTNLHIFAASHQPATRYVVTIGHGEKAIRRTFRLRPTSYVLASCCNRRRWAKYCTTQVYYDMQPFWCRKGRGCK